MHPHQVVVSAHRLPGVPGRNDSFTGADAPEITASFRDPAGNVIGVYQPPADQSYEAWVDLLIGQGAEGLSGFGD